MDKNSQIYPAVYQSSFPEIDIKFTKDTKFSYPLSSMYKDESVLAFNKAESYQQKINSIAQLICHDKTLMYKKYSLAEKKGDAS